MLAEPVFNFKLETPGKAAASFACGGEKVNFDLTNISNPLGDLLRGIASLIIEPAHLWGEDNSCHVEWYSDQCCYRWVISTDATQQARISITQTNAIFDDEESREVMSATCGFYVFCHAIVSELDLFVKQMGLLNYEQKWQRDEFPITYLLFLKKHLIDNNQWRATRHLNGTLSDELLLLLA